MVRAIKMDLKKLFGDYHIYTCMLGLAFVYMLVHLQSTSAMGSITTITNAYQIIVNGNEIMLLGFLFGVIGGGFLYCAEEKYGYLGFGVQRVGTGIYTISKIIVSFLGGVCTTFAGHVLFFMGMLVHKYFFPALYVTMAEHWEHWMDMFWTLIFSALRCGMLSVIGFLVTTYMANFYIGMAMPLIIYYGILQIEYWVYVLFPMFPDSLNFSTRYSVAPNQDSDMEHFLLTILYTIVLMIGIYVITKKRIERRLEHA